ncbi:hypothetical protein DEO45_03520 [Rhodanobacter denitrificans]|uniref:Uncharacterized protein n=1 Tax=Rhodanobacter denitrificans TaxID=666685 RepID=A0A368KG03_9GAMM|nr:hypothetical protein DEO45_03520 [Rhodanobacter denitrificans]
MLGTGAKAVATVCSTDGIARLIHEPNLFARRGAGLRLSKFVSDELLFTPSMGLTLSCCALQD